MMRGRAKVKRNDVRADGGSVFCQVPGCNVEVTHLKDFNLRCRVCKDCSKADCVVLSDGERYRFCQQCNKFQLASEFEDGKRGCRAKLLIHNVRRQQRRKQKAMQKKLSHVLSDIGRGNRQATADEIQRLTEGVIPDGWVGDGGKSKLGVSSLSPALSSSNDCASAHELKELSADAPTGSNATVVTGSVCDEEIENKKQMQGSLNSATNFPLLIFDDEDTSDFGYGSLVSDKMAQDHFPEYSDMLKPSQQLPPKFGQSASVLDPSLLDDLVMDAVGMNHLCTGPGCATCARQRMDCRDIGMYSKPAALTMPELLFGANYEPLPEEHHLRMSMKIYDITPADLPTDLEGRFGFAMQANSPSDITGYMRPGCVHLTVDCNVTPKNVEEVTAALPDRVIASLFGHDLSWAGKKIKAVLPGWNITMDEDCCRIVEPQDADSAPMIKMVQIATADNRIQVHVEGWQMLQMPRILVRQDGNYLETEVVTVHENDDASFLITFNLINAEYGIAWVEIVDDASGNFTMTEAFPTLITDSEEAVDELHRFTCSNNPISLPQATALLRDVANVVHGHPEAEGALDSSMRLAFTAASRGCSYLLSEAFIVAGSSMDQHTLQSLLFAAVKSRTLQVVSDVISFFLINGLMPRVGEVDSVGMTVMHWAALSGCPGIIRMLLNVSTESQDVWDSAQGPAPDFHVPRDMMYSRADILDSLASEKSMPTQSLDNLDEHAQLEWSMVVPVIPLLLLLSMMVGMPSRSEWGSWALALVMSGIPEYMLRSGIWSIRKQIHSVMTAKAQEVQFGAGLHPVKLVFQDEAMDTAYFSSWFKTVARYDVLIVAVFIAKAYCVSFSLDYFWLAAWAIPALTMLIGRCFWPGSGRLRECSNITLSLFSWACFFLGTTNQLNNPVNSANGISWQLVVSNCVTAFFISAHNATVYPFRIRHCCISGMLHMLLVTVGMQWHLTRFGSDKPVLGLARSLAHALVPGIWAAVGAELPCRQMELYRMAQFLSATKKSKVKTC